MVQEGKKTVRRGICSASGVPTFLTCDMMSSRCTLAGTIRNCRALVPGDGCLVLGYCHPDSDGSNREPSTAMEKTDMFRSLC